MGQAKLRGTREQRVASAVAAAAAALKEKEIRQIAEAKRRRLEQQEAAEERERRLELLRNVHVDTPEPEKPTEPKAKAPAYTRNVPSIGRSALVWAALAVAMGSQNH